MKKLITLPFILLSIILLVSCNSSNDLSDPQESINITREMVTAAVNERIYNINNKNEIRLFQSWNVGGIMTTRRELRIGSTGLKLFNSSVETIGVGVLATGHVVYDEQAWIQDTSNGGWSSLGWNRSLYIASMGLIDQFLDGLTTVPVMQSLLFIINNFNNFTITVVGLNERVVLSMTDIINVHSFAEFDLHKKDDDIHLELLQFGQTAPGSEFNTIFSNNVHLWALPPELQHHQQ